MAPPRVYLAGPEVFLPDAKEVGRRKVAICAEHGLIGIFPLDAEVDVANLSPFDAGCAISAANEALMRTCDTIIANMTPFRGPSMDVGTAFEMGFMRALEKPVFGYTNDPRPYADRAAPDGMIVEDFAMIDNLMLHGAVEASDGAVIIGPPLGEDTFHDLTVFDACIRRLAVDFRSRAAAD